MTGAHHLSGEELEELGGAHVVARYGLEPGQVAGMLLLGGVLSFVGLGGVLMLRQRFGLAPWAGERADVSVVDLATFMVVMGCYALAWSQAVWFLTLSCWRRLGASPALVAGAHGLRAHGTWPWPRVLAWAEVVDVTAASGRLLQVTPTAPPSRLAGWFGSPLRVPVVDADAAALAAALRGLREAALAGAPPPPGAVDDPVR
ncbi:MAG: hypothetical protein M9894_24880 [Planctomycetes bacterium]|nr:hypothetical protein [Planctomycetota bacterium]